MRQRRNAINTPVRAEQPDQSDEAVSLSEPCSSFRRAAIRRVPLCLGPRHTDVNGCAAARLHRGEVCYSRTPTPERPREPNADALNPRRGAAVSTGPAKRACRWYSLNIAGTGRVLLRSRDYPRSRLNPFGQREVCYPRRDGDRMVHPRVRSLNAFSNPRSLSRKAVSIAGTRSATGSSTP